MTAEAPAADFLLAGRTARCTHCGNERPSSPNLAFFEYCGPGSKEATEVCECGYYECCHDDGHGHRRDGGEREPVGCASFRRRGDLGHDRFYCGCHGWD